ncbi:MAG: Unknown protein [uncultured Aureispira sp.]|uniref:Uncharacterized protein n=1 Tax=uncultured Aureispira sp. TaxID=1331704 RepID=A0A6S6S8D5_9BACT|nr:MAG: Unknown protein [uncultured Aureispira sp.]
MGWQKGSKNHFFLITPVTQKIKWFPFVIAKEWSIVHFGRNRIKIWYLVCILGK